jgi:beta-N-acetylhexosaminidase
MLDIEGFTLSETERELLQHPAVGGVILFARNYAGREQLVALCAEIRALRKPHLLIAVDQEGGRVQRFRDGFTRLPSMACLGELHRRDPSLSLRLAHEGGWLMASELLACGLDLSFAPVLDVDRARSRIIGDRAFADDPDVVSSLARAWAVGMREAGMAGVGKHFPGHGGVAEDSHDELPHDPRDLASFRARDLVPFERLTASDADGAALTAVMTAHLQVDAVDARPVTFSHRWLRQILRGELNFGGAILSDDLSMHAAQGQGAAPDRAAAALAAGCDMVLVCNDAEAAQAVVQGVDLEGQAVRTSRLAPLRGHARLDWSSLISSARHGAARRKLEAMELQPDLDLHDDNSV